MTKDEALKLAKECGATTYTNRHYPEATAVTFSPLAWVKFCEQAIAAPAQEPVATLFGSLPVYDTPPVQEPVIFYRCNGCGHAYEEIPPTSCDCMDGGGFNRVDYYTTPLAQRPWVGLTDEEKQEWVELMPDEPKPRHIMNLINVIEVELKEKNT
jgi:rubredoxin